MRTNGSSPRTWPRSSVDVGASGATPLRFLAREIGFSAALLLGVSVVIFVIVRLAPGDAFAALLGQSAGAEARAALAVPSGALQQYAAWLWQVLHGDLGASLRSGRPVAAELLEAGLNTLGLTVAAMLAMLALALPLAIFGAARPHAAANRALTLLAYALSALPVFWVGYLVVFAATRYLGFFPIGTTAAAAHPWLHFALPVLVLGLGSGLLGEAIRHLRLELGQVLAQDYMRTARAMGVPLWRHAYKQGVLVPLAAVAGGRAPFLLGGAIIVEQIFNRPGLGRLAWQAAQDRDFPLIIGVTLAAALLVRLAALARHAVFVWVNPQAREA